MDDAYREPVRLADPDPAWRGQYAEEAARIVSALERFRPDVEHIGSTSVPLRGKPVIDMQIAIEESDRAPAVAALERMGYQHHGRGRVPDREYLTRRFAEAPAINLHVFPRTSSLLDDNRMIRDYLREHPEAAQKYVATKERALAQGHFDLLSYSHAKDRCVGAIREAAHRWARSRRRGLQR